MSRLTGNDVVDMLEAYQAVYSPQEEISEEQIWEEVEEWVNSLVEEGHDLSEFTWEDMYEAYIAEAGNPGGALAATRARQAQARAAKPAPAQMRGLSIGKGGFNIGGKPVNSGMSPIFQRSGAKPTPSAAAPAARPAATARPSAAPAAKPAPTAASSTVLAKKGGVEGKLDKSTGKFTAGSFSGAERQRYTARGGSASPASSAPTSPSAKPAPTAAAKPSISSQLDDIRTMKSASVMRQNNMSLPGAKNPTSGDIKKSQAVSSMVSAQKSRESQVAKANPTKPVVGSGSVTPSSPSTSAAPAAAKTKPKPKLDGDGTPMGQTRNEPLWNGFDMFDVVKGHLIGEGYADTEEAAIAIMANMSESWKLDIVEAEVLAAKGGVPGTLKVKPTREGGFLGIGAKTVNKPVPGSFKPKDVSSTDAARYNTALDKRLSTDGRSDSEPATTIQRKAKQSGHSGYMKVNNPDSIPNTGIPNRPTPQRAGDQNRAR